MLYVARHGETDWNREGRYQGQRESDLTATGIAQADALAHSLYGVPLERIVSSPLRRCTATAWPLARRRRLPVESDLRLIEIAHGTWEGRLRGAIEREDGPRLARWRSQPQEVAFPGGESLAQVRSRWRAFVTSLDTRVHTLLVTHDVLVRIAILDATGRELEDFWKARVVNGGFASLAYGNGSWNLVEECVDAHLVGMLVDTANQAL